MSENYVFYEVYVEGVEGPRYLCVKNDESIITSNPASIESCSKILGLIPYERVIDYIDLLEGRTKKTLGVLIEDPSTGIYRGFLLGENTPICLQEVQGSYIFIQSKEGFSVKPGDLLGYTVSDKLETRKIKSNCEGLIVFIIDQPWEEPRKTLVVVASEYRSITARKNP